MPSPMEERMKAMLAQNARGGSSNDNEGGKGSKGSSDDGKGKGDDGKGKGKGKSKDPYQEEMTVMTGNPQSAGPPLETWDVVGRHETVPFKRKSRNAGIHTIEVYAPQFYFVQTEMEEFDAGPDRYGPTVIGKYTKGIGQVEARFPTDDEDPISFCLTVVHRLLERMEAKGINETGHYQPDGRTLNVWHAIGRIDVGTESITDRSKSMKSFIMDLFERYANESNIEGVDQYNACYGGQACGLCTLSWVESDRWDGRYGIAVATDISEAHPATIAFVGSATTATLFFPDAPLPHHSQRASCVMHRYDFCKPVGWHDMAPVTDGKYSVECYLDALDACYATLRQKLNGRGPLEVTDYNVFHTGGGYHIVRKAFERLVRNEKKVTPQERDQLVATKLAPSVSLLKVIGPCHTVSSFLNIASTVMNTMEKALGKIILVFTYGSGCAASMYQLRVDDVAFMDPLEVWKLQFYRNAVKMTPFDAMMLHAVYVETWMKFTFIPHGRRTQKVSVWHYEEDAYYLMEIDKFGRRFYHRGGMSTGPLDPSLRLPVDKAEERPSRESWGPILARPEEKKLAIDSKEERFKAIEYAMAFGDDSQDSRYEELVEYTDRYNPSQVVTIRRPVQNQISVQPDGDSHSYQIVGSWSNRQPQEMQSNQHTWTFEVVVGENRWESFYLLQDNDPDRRILPNEKNAGQSAVPVGPLSSGPRNDWLLDCRNRVNVPSEQVGMPGDKYLVTFRWEKLKELSWEKLEGEKGEITPGRYYLSGSWNDWDCVEMHIDNTGLRRRKQGWYSAEVEMTSASIEFKILRNQDSAQCIYPQAPAPSTGLLVTQHSQICGPDDGESGLWKIEDAAGAIYKISFFRDPGDCEASSMRVDWKKVGEKAAAESKPGYYLASQSNGWLEKTAIEMVQAGNVYVGELQLQELSTDSNAPTEKRPQMPFHILMHRNRGLCIHPDQDFCTQLSTQNIIMDENPQNLSWCIGKHASDKAEKEDVFIVRLEVVNESFSVSWSKKH